MYCLVLKMVSIRNPLAALPNFLIRRTPIPPISNEISRIGTGTTQINVQISRSLPSSPPLMQLFYHLDTLIKSLTGSTPA